MPLKTNKTMVSESTHCTSSPSELFMQIRSRCQPPARVSKGVPCRGLCGTLTSFQHALRAPHSCSCALAHSDRLTPESHHPKPHFCQANMITLLQFPQLPLTTASDELLFYSSCPWDLTGSRLLCEQINYSYYMTNNKLHFIIKRLNKYSWT